MADLPRHPLGFPYKARLDYDAQGQEGCLSLQKDN